MDTRQKEKTVEKSLGISEHTPKVQGVNQVVSPKTINSGGLAD